MKNKKSLLKKILILILLIPLIIAFIPIKFTKPTTKFITENEFYIVTFVSEFSTDAGSCILVDSYNGSENQTNSVKLIGNKPQNTISWDIYNSYTKFIIYGSLTQNEDGYYTLNCESWDILGKVKGRKSICSYYLCLYDLNIFDKWLVDKGY